MVTNPPHWLEFHFQLLTINTVNISFITMYVLFILCDYLAMQMWSMAFFFPLVMGYLIPKENEHWENFLRLLDIMDILFARSIPVDELGYLESLIHDHHSCIKELYPDVSITPKMHSIIHLPRLIYKFI